MKILITLLSIVLISSFAQAKEAAIAKNFIQSGAKAFKEKQWNQAIDEFSRGLLLEPYDESAHTYLNRLIGEPAIESSQKVKLIQFQDLTTQIVRIKDRIDTLSLQNAAYWQDLMTKGFSKSLLMQQLNLTKLEELTLGEANQQKMQEQYRLKDNPLEALNAYLLVEYDRFNLKAKYLEKQQAQMRQMLQKGVERYASIPVASDKSIQAYKQSFSDQIPQDKRVRDILQDEGIKLKVEALTAQVSDLQKTIAAKDAKLNKLTDQVVTYALKQVDLEKKFSERAFNYEGVTQEIKELNARVELGQKIIQDKEMQIQDLQMQLSKKQKTKADKDNVGKSAAVSEDQMVELNGFLQIYKGKLADATKTIKISSAQIVTLEEQLNFVQTQMLEKDRVIEKTKKDLLTLEKEIGDLQAFIDALNPDPADATPLQTEELIKLQTKLIAIKESLQARLTDLNESKTTLSVGDLETLHKILGPNL